MLAISCAPAELTSPQSFCAVQPPGKQWPGAARWIAGLSDSGFSASLNSDQRAAWDDFAKHDNGDWARFSKQYLAPIEDWRARNVGVTHAGTAFYPFGGPDAINLLSFYPDAREYLLIGLEPVGCIPGSLNGYSPAYFAELRRSLSDIITMDFFITANMRREVTRSDLNGVLPILLFLVSRAGYAINSVTPIGIAPDGSIVSGSSLAQRETPGIAIQFSDARHGMRTLRYFSLDLTDYKLRSKPGSATYLTTLPDTVTLLKAASYLMHHDNFSTIRSLILAKSRMVLEEDSGIPYRFFGADAWNVHLFGSYSEPIPLFRKWRQNDLRAAYTAGTEVQPLPFGIGYRHKDQANLLLAVRKGR